MQNTCYIPVGHARCIPVHTVCFITSCARLTSQPIDKSWDWLKTELAARAVTFAHEQCYLCTPQPHHQQLGDVITRVASAAGLSVVRTYCGHGICDLFHCAPNIPHYAGNKVRLSCSWGLCGGGCGSVCCIPVRIMTQIQCDAHFEVMRSLKC